MHSNKNFIIITCIILSKLKLQIDNYIFVLQIFYWILYHITTQYNVYIKI